MAEGQKSWTWGGMVKGAVKIAAVVVACAAIYVGVGTALASAGVGAGLSMLGGGAATAVTGQVGVFEALQTNAGALYDNVTEGVSNLLNSDTANETKQAASEALEDGTEAATELANDAASKAKEIGNDALKTTQNAINSVTTTVSNWFGSSAETLGQNLNGLSVEELKAFDFTSAVEPFDAVKASATDLASNVGELSKAIEAAGGTDEAKKIGLERLLNSSNTLNSSAAATLDLNSPAAIREQMVTLLDSGKGLNDVEHLVPALKENATAVIDELASKGIEAGGVVDAQNAIIKAADNLLGSADKVTGAIDTFTEIGNDIINPGMTTGTIAAIAAGGAVTAGAGYWTGKVAQDRENQQQQGNPYL